MEKKVSHVVEFLSNVEVQSQLQDSRTAGISFSFDLRSLLKNGLEEGTPQFYTYSMRDSFHEWYA